MDKDTQRGIASRGGVAAHEKGTAHEWTSEEAREAGRKGGLASAGRRLGKQDANPALAAFAELDELAGGRSNGTDQSQ
jgi:general stress protein YciG